MSEVVALRPLASWCRNPALPSRARIEAEVERLHDTMQVLLVVLDHLDGDPEAEPSLASVELSEDGSQVRWAAGNRLDDHREQDADLEPVLGGVTVWQSGRIITGSTDPREGL